jgi:hypothetical protein
VSHALNLQNLILPAGTVKVGTREYLIQINSSPELVAGLNDMPIKTVNGTTVYMLCRRPSGQFWNRITSPWMRRIVAMLLARPVRSLDLRPFDVASSEVSSIGLVISAKTRK